MTPEIQKALTLLDNFMRQEQCGAVCKTLILECEIEIEDNELEAELPDLHLFDIQFVKRQHLNHYFKTMECDDIHANRIQFKTAFSFI